MYVKKMVKNYSYSDITGQRFGKLIVIKRVPKEENSKYKYAVWLCKCDCGNERLVRSAELKRGRIHHCGNKNCYDKLDSYTASFNSLYTRYKTEAKKRNLEFKLTPEEFKIITSMDCLYCGRKPSQISKPPHRYFMNEPMYYIYNGIDRVDNSKGYVFSNSWACCEVCNRMKRDMTVDEFFNQINSIYKAQGGFECLLESNAGIA